MPKRFLILGLVAALSSTGSATLWNINATLDGLQEVPANASPGAGTLIGTLDDTTGQILMTVTFTGLLGSTTAAHLHGPAGPGVNGPVIVPLGAFPLGVSSGVSFTNAVLLPADVTHLLAGNVYANVHTNVFPGGEIRGQLSASAVPEPSVMLLSLAALASAKLRRKRA